MKRFSYYKKLNFFQRRTYDKSEAITELNLPQAERFADLLKALQQALVSTSQEKTQHYSQRLLDAFCYVYEVPKVEVIVLEKRPSNRRGELHGLYTQRPKQIATIHLWMRTAKRKDVVAFKTYLRTLLHELLHHLDFTLFKWKDSFHTLGFYQRESSLLRQLPLSEFQESA